MKPVYLEYFRERDFLENRPQVGFADRQVPRGGLGQARLFFVTSCDNLFPIAVI
jgi:hypothetical protein